MRSPFAVEGFIQKTVALLFAPARRQPPGDCASLRFGCELTGAADMAMEKASNNRVRMVPFQTLGEVGSVNIALSSIVVALVF